MSLETERQKFNENKAMKAMERVVAPSVEQRRKFREGVNNYVYIAIIGIVSLLAIVIPPLVNGCLSGEIGLSFPKTTEGWILWSLLNGGTAIGNISLLVLFKLQAKKNSKNDPNFIKANEILNKLAGRKEVFIPRSPAKMNTQAYTKKVLMILVSTLASSVVLTSIVISFDWLTLLSCILSVLISICVSWIAMISDEEYWTNEYLLYAELTASKVCPEVVKELSQEEKKESENA